MRDPIADILLRRDWIVLVASGALLGLAGVAKFLDAAPTTRFLHALFYADLRSVILLIALAEVGLALWLVSGIRARAAAALSSCLFGGFAVTHVYVELAVANAPSCGCMGQIAGAADLPVEGWVLLNLFMSIACAAVAGRWKWRPIRSRIAVTQEAAA